MRHLVLVSALGLAGAVTAFPADASDRASRREQAAAASEELDRKFTAAYVRQHILTGATTRAQVIALYGDYYQESVDSSGASLLYDKSDIRNRTTTGVRRFANRLSGLTDLAGHIPGVSGSAAQGAANRAISPVNRAGAAAGTTERLRDNAEAYNSMDRLSIAFDGNGTVVDFNLY